MPQDLGDRLQGWGSRQDPEKGEEQVILRPSSHHPSPIAIATAIATGRWEEGASPQDEKAACWVTVLSGHHAYLHKGPPQSLVWE